MRSVPAVPGRSISPLESGCEAQPAAHARRGWALAVARHVGLFGLSRRIYRRRLNILCYHGFSLHDEHVFRPKLFMTAATFARRMAHLADLGYRVVTLDHALRRLDSGEADLREVVVTIDDGFHSVLAVAAPVLNAHGFPATLYMTSYYSQHAHPVFRLAVRYMFWKGRPDGIDAAAFVPDGAFSERPLCERIVQYGERHLDEAGRMALLRRLGDATGVPLAAIEDGRALSLLTPAELRRLAEYGIDVQLHTHRHRFPLEAEALTDEIEANQRFLAACEWRQRRHLCYPSGRWNSDMWPVMQRCGVVTATTCDAGLNRRDTPRLALHRFLDNETISDIQFEAELCGFKQLLRDIGGLLHGRWPGSTDTRGGPPPVAVLPSVHGAGPSPGA